MGNVKIKAANDLQKFANTFRGLLDLADELADVGSLEQAADEAGEHLLNLNAQIAEKEAYFAKLLESEKQRHKSTLNQMDEEVASLKKEAQEITRKASNAAAVMLDNAHKEAKAIMDAARKEVAEASLKLSDIDADIDVAKVDLADIERDIADRKREHGNITKIIADLKAKF